ncbi:MAG: cyclic nucleotide-binding domain-containing protein [Pirellulales bacterium]|nr:cyclic nucleotide-binding domain-containing protein [Pirellulales bacterium]
MISPESLRRYPLFADMSEEHLKTLAMNASEEIIPEGTQMFGEGDTAEYFNIIVKGEVDIQYLLGDEHRQTVDTLTAGDPLCWSALVDPYKTSAFGTANKETHLIRIKAEAMREMCEKDPMLGYRVMKRIARLLGDRLQNARVQLATLD